MVEDMAAQRRRHTLAVDPRILALAAALVLAVTVTAPAQDSPPRGFRDDIETIAFERVNQVRAELGLGALAPDPALTAIARVHSRDMLEWDYLGHVDREGRGPAERAGADHRRLVGEVSENVWSAVFPESRSPNDVAVRIVDAMIASAGHRRNMLAPELTHLGLGVDSAPGRTGGIEYRATQLFAAVAAYLEEPAPERLIRGRSVAFSLDGPDGGPSGMEFFDLWSPSEQRVVFGPAGLVLARLSGDAGPYRLRFYRPLEGNSYQVFLGPSVVLE